MMITLIGQTDTKRTEYFKRAAENCQVPFSLIEWEKVEEFYYAELNRQKTVYAEMNRQKTVYAEMNRQKMVYSDESLGEKSVAHVSFKRAVIKIDPPSYRIFSLEDMKQQMEIYQKHLQQLEQMDAVFLNTPKVIRELLNKRTCKLQLQKAKVPVTGILLEKVKDFDMLLNKMEKKRQYSVFLKPVCFSGAAGVTALRIQPHTGKMQAYTSCKRTDGKLVNTKTLYCMNDREEILALLHEIFKLDVMAERWLPKSTFQGKSYDLRVVYQFGHIAHMVVRQAKGPITNLHLNNQALRIEELGLSREKLEELEEICGRAVAAFPGLSMAGIDILLEKNSQKPYIIEMNGQGDLIYQDIFEDNRIYKEQVERMIDQSDTIKNR